ncbi:MAG: hypothetical protein IRZ07_02520 [Microbispora sp.]|nr:hypothetical protein [Microbispora sp.]
MWSPPRSPRSTIAAGSTNRRSRPSSIEDLRARHGGEHNVSVVKEALAQLGVCGRAVRPPMTELSGPDRQRVSDILRTLA